MVVAVLTVDQRRSRSEADRVPAMIDRLAGASLLRPLQRTAGDEFQAVLADPDALPQVLEPLLRDTGWHVGLGFGDTEDPLPASTRAGRGEAFLLAREAVTAAKSSPWHLRVAGTHPVARQLESAIWLWAAVLGRRTPGGWEVVDLVDQGLTYEETGRRLGISQSAVSQRAQAAGLVEGRRARELVAWLAAQALGGGG